jgi:hypothetical protein
VLKFAEAVARIKSCGEGARVRMKLKEAHYLAGLDLVKREACAP